MCYYWAFICSFSFLSSVKTATAFMVDRFAGKDGQRTRLSVECTPLAEFNHDTTGSGVLLITDSKHY